MDVKRARIDTVVGEKLGDGCSFSYRGESELDKGYRVETREMSFNPDLCVSEHLVVEVEQEVSSGAEIRSSWKRSGWHQARLRDPIKLAVNWVRVHRAVYSDGRYSGEGRTGHLAATGWSRIEYGYL